MIFSNEDLCVEDFQKDLSVEKTQAGPLGREYLMRYPFIEDIGI